MLWFRHHLGMMGSPSRISDGQLVSQLTLSHVVVLLLVWLVLPVDEC